MFSARNVTVLSAVFILIGGAAFLSLNYFQKAPIVSPNPAPTNPPLIAEVQSSFPESESYEVTSPDGEMTLLMEKMTSEGSIAYSFIVAEGETRREAFSKTVLPGTSFELSPNIWSPDNKYFFITEKTGSSVNYFVFRSNGEFFAESEQYINIVPIFSGRDTGYTLSEITGWDSEALLHIYTIKEDGTNGPSFWFEIPGGAIIQLAHR
jgi:hypothetical protein